MFLPVCGDPDCPNRRRVEELERQVRALERDVAKLRGLEPDRCPEIIGGERCGRRVGHEGNCVWRNGD